MLSAANLAQLARYCSEAARMSLTYSHTATLSKAGSNASIGTPAGESRRATDGFGAGRHIELVRCISRARQSINLFMNTRTRENADFPFKNNSLNIHMNK